MTFLRRLLMSRFAPDSASERLAEELETYTGYRVLRAIDTDVGSPDLRPAGPAERIGVVLDTETTGLDPYTDRIVELAVQRFLFTPQGRISAVERVRSWLEDPRRPMPERLVRLTGLTDVDLAGQRLDDDEIVTLVGKADLIIAHNAAFDRPFFDRRFPQLSELPWGCSLVQLDWLELGFDGRALGHLIMQAGRFFEGHRAGNDVVALSALLGTCDGERTLLSYLLERCEVNSVRVDAVGAPYDAKDSLKAAGYRWDPKRRAWWREVDEGELPREIAWLSDNVYFGRGQASVRRITPRERFARPD